MFECVCSPVSVSLVQALFSSRVSGLASLDIVGLMSSGLTPGLTPETVYLL